MAAEPAEATGERWRIGDDLWVGFVDITSLREQDVNAQVMQPRHFERLTENIRDRGQLESLPYCYQPNGAGPVEIVSGHHRVRAARAAGMTRIPAIIDTRPMTRSKLIAKQISHNELHGNPDADVLAQLVAMIDNVDDLLATGLDETQLPTVDRDDTNLATPHGEFDWRLVALTFLPHQLDDFKAALSVIDKGTDLIGVAPVACFKDFVDAAYQFGMTRNIHNIATIITALTDLARREVQAAADAKAAAADLADDDVSTPV